MSSGTPWRLLRRDIQRGWEAIRSGYKTFPRIEKWVWPFGAEPLQGIAVHLLTGRDDWLSAAWMLASWFEFSAYPCPVFIHDDGTLPEKGCGLLEKLFPTARIISREEADSKMKSLMNAFPFCHDYRRANPRALKIFDMAQFTPGTRFYIFDTDLLFFQRPSEILDWVASEAEECWFNQDFRENSLITAEEARDELGIEIWPRVNSGLCLIAKAAIDLALCDRALAATSLFGADAVGVEQTLFMLCAAHYGRGGLLPTRYEVSPGSASAEDAVSRNYLGAVRERCYAQGIERLRERLLRTRMGSPFLTDYSPQDRWLAPGGEFSVLFAGTPERGQTNAVTSQGANHVDFAQFLSAERVQRAEVLPSPRDRRITKEEAHRHGTAWTQLFGLSNVNLAFDDLNFEDQKLTIQGTRMVAGIATNYMAVMHWGKKTFMILWMAEPAKLFLSSIRSRFFESVRQRPLPLLIQK